MDFGLDDVLGGKVAPLNYAGFPFPLFFTMVPAAFE